MHHTPNIDIYDRKSLEENGVRLKEELKDDFSVTRFDVSQKGKVSLNMTSKIPGLTGTRKFEDIFKLNEWLSTQKITRDVLHKAQDYFKCLYCRTMLSFTPVRHIVQ